MSGTKYKVSVACVLNYKDEILLINEIKDGVEAFDIPAGGVEINETLEHACEREAFEEVGVKINNYKLLGYVLETVDEVVTVSFVYLENLLEKPFINLSILEEEDITSFKWVTKSELSNLLNDSKNWEHSLAIKRLKLFLGN